MSTASLADQADQIREEIKCWETSHREPDGQIRDPEVIAAMEKLAAAEATIRRLAALQGLIDPEDHLQLHGTSDSAYRERIGNAVPPPAAAAIANVMGTTLLLAWSGETFTLSNQPVWVRPIVAAVQCGREIGA